MGEYSVLKTPENQVEKIREYGYNLDRELRNRNIAAWGFGFTAWRAHKKYGRRSWFFVFNGLYPVATVGYCERNLSRNGRQVRVHKPSLLDHFREAVKTTNEDLGLDLKVVED